MADTALAVGVLAAVLACGISIGYRVRQWQERREREALKLQRRQWEEQ